MKKMSSIEITRSTDISNLDFSKITDVVIKNEISIENILLIIDNLLKYNIVTNLRIYGSNIENLPILNNLVTLYCNYCDLKYIPILPKLKNLTICYCNNITNIPELLELEKLDISYCNNLIYLSRLPNLTYLSCVYTNFKNIDTISYYPKLSYLILSGYKIESIPYLPNLKTLKCYECHYLNYIPILPNLTNLELIRCDSLDNIPILPKLEELYYENSIINEYSVPIKFLKIDNELLNNIDNYIEYNDLNLEYLKTMYDNGQIANKYLEKVEEILNKNLLVKNAK